MLVVSGLLNKQIAGELGISEITVKAHRGRLMRKMNADSVADLVMMAATLGLSPRIRSRYTNGLDSTNTSGVGPPRAAAAGAGSLKPFTWTESVRASGLPLRTTKHVS